MACYHCDSSPGDYSGALLILFISFVLFCITSLSPQGNTYVHHFDNSSIKTQYVGISTNGDG
uniref:p7B n=1 Tax=Melon necrotic spot virus TaxID=11987 RepID=Q8JMH9_MNSV|nr:p7B [Melon necrotic spot virus]